jgi:hypothetical protein
VAVGATGVLKLLDAPTALGRKSPLERRGQRVAEPRVLKGLSAGSAEVQSGSTLMISLGLWIASTGMVALSFECLGAALVLFGIAGWLLS